MTDVVAVLSIPIEADPAKVDAALARVEAGLRKTEQTGRAAGRGIGDGVGQATPALQRAEREALAFARAQAALQRDTGDLAGAIRTLQSALDASSQSGVREINTMRQLARYQNEVAQGANKAASGVSRLAQIGQGLQGALGAAGLGLGIAQIVSFGSSAAQSAQQLEKTEATVRALSGSQTRYAEVVRIAEQNQRLLGGSLNDNLQPLQQFLFISNRTGASLQQLNQVAQLLATVNPAEGIAGAGFALSEALSGDLTSIVERFNLPRQAVRNLLNEAKNADEVLAGVTQLLAEQGVTAETLAASLNTDANAYDRAGASINTLTTNLGSLVSTGLAPATRGLDLVVTKLNDLISKAEQGRAIVANQGAGLAAASGSYEEYSAKVDKANQVITTHNTVLSTALGPLGQFAGEMGATIEPVQKMSEAEFLAQQAQLAQAQAAEEAAAATDAHTTASQANSTATQQAAQTAAEAALQRLQQAEASRQSEQAETELEAALREAAAAGTDAGAIVAQLVSKYDLEAGKLYELIGLYRERNSLAAVNPAYTAKTYGGSIPADAVRAMQQSQESQQALRQAQLRELERQQGGRFGTATPGYKPPGSSARGGGGGGSAGGKTAATKAAEQEAQAIQQITDQYHKRQIDAERTYQERITSIAEDYAKKRADAERSLSSSQLSGRAGFYDQLRQLDASQRDAAAAAFEAGEQKVAEVAAAQGADVAQAYREANQQIVLDQAKRQAEIAKLREEGKQAEADYLAGVDALYRQAEEDRLNQILAGRDSLQSQEQAAQDEAAQQRQAAIGEAATQAGDALAEAQRKAGDATAPTNAALQQQLDLLDQIAQRGGLPGAGGVSPAAVPSGTTTTTTAAPGAAGGQGQGGPLAVNDAGNGETLSSILRTMEEAVRALRSLGDRPNYSPGV